MLMIATIAAGLDSDKVFYIALILDGVLELTGGIALYRMFA